MFILTQSTVFRSIIFLLAVPAISYCSQLEIAAYCKDKEKWMAIGNAYLLCYSKHHKTNKIFCQTLGCGFEDPQILLESKSSMSKVTIELTDEKKCYVYEHYCSPSFKIDITLDCKCRLPDNCLIDDKTCLEDRGLWQSPESEFEEQQNSEDEERLISEITINITDKEKIYLYDPYVSSYLKMEIFIASNCKTMNACLIIVCLTAVLLFIACQIAIPLMTRQSRKKEYRVRGQSTNSGFENEHKLLNSGVEEVFADN